MSELGIPQRLVHLLSEESKLRSAAARLVEADVRLTLHLVAVEHAMDVADIYRQWPTDDEDAKVIKMLGMRIFNAFAASLNLAVSGYSQNSALIMRDILETVFLLDLFRGDKSLITKWRTADAAVRHKLFRPVKVREELDKRQGVSGKRAEMYSMFSELAGHPTMNSHLMLRPMRGGDAVSGPFIEATSFAATIAEMGRLGVQAGESLAAFVPPDWDRGRLPLEAFAAVKLAWFQEFYTPRT